MRGRTVLVTGATSGIGRATAAALAQRGATVLIHGRSAQSATATVGELEAGAGRLVPVHGDLGSLAGVRELAGQVTDELHVLVNNAGAAFAQRNLSPEGLERTIAVNHLASAALTVALLGPLRAGAEAAGRPSRVVNLSSTVERRGNPDLAAWSHPGRYRQLQAYCDAKLINLAYTYGLAAELDGTGVTVNAADPGNVATRFGHNAGGVFNVIQVLGRPLLAGPDRGARTSLRLATDPALDGQTGGYYSKGVLATSSPASRDPELSQRIRARTTALLTQHRFTDR